MMTETKLHIEIGGNVLDVEGDNRLVEKIYNDFKEQIAAVEPLVAPVAAANSDVPGSVVVVVREEEGTLAQPLPGMELRGRAIGPDVAPIVQLTRGKENVL